MAQSPQRLKEMGVEMFACSTKWVNHIQMSDLLSDSMRGNLCMGNTLNLHAE